MALGEIQINMIINYEVKCSCGFFAQVKYGKVGKDEIYEIFSCPECKNLFSLEAKEKIKCKTCKNTRLIPYNPNKKENLRYYQDMSEGNMLIESKLKELKTFWDKISDDACPKCKKNQLIWKNKSLEVNK